MSALPKPNPFANRVGIGKPYNLQMKTALPMAASLPVKARQALLKSGKIRMSLLTIEMFKNDPPPMTELTTETFSNDPPPMTELVTEDFRNDPPPMSLLTTEDFDGYTVTDNVNLQHTSNESGFNVTVEQDVDGLGNWQSLGAFALGDITSQAFYPGRQHRSTAPASVNGKNISPPGSNVVLFTPSYSVKTVINFNYV